MFVYMAIHCIYIQIFFLENVMQVMFSVCLCDTHKHACGIRGLCWVVVFRSNLFFFFPNLLTGSFTGFVY